MSWEREHLKKQSFAQLHNLKKITAHIYLHLCTAFNIMVWVCVCLKRNCKYNQCVIILFIYMTTSAWMCYLHIQWDSIYCSSCSVSRFKNVNTLEWFFGKSPLGVFKLCSKWMELSCSGVTLQMNERLRPGLAVLPDAKYELWSPAWLSDKCCFIHSLQEEKRKKVCKKEAQWCHQLTLHFIFIRLNTLHLYYTLHLTKTKREQCVLRRESSDLL